MGKFVVRMLVGLLLFYPLTLLGQFTAVTATVVDPTGKPYANCSFTASFVGQNTVPGHPPYTLAGVPGGQFQQQTGGSCTSAAILQTSLADNNQISPLPSQWQFNVCDQSRTYCFNSLCTVTGTTSDLSACINANAVPLPGGGGGGTGQIPINGLLSATGANIINNGSYPQGWVWNLVGPTPMDGLFLGESSTPSTNTGPFSSILAVATTAGSSVAPFRAIAHDFPPRTGPGLEVTPAGDIQALNGANIFTNIAGTGMQCVQADITGRLVGTGVPCGSNTGNGPIPLSSLLPAQGFNNINNGSNEQIWNWVLTGTNGQNGIYFGEAAPSTNSGTDSSIVVIGTQPGSTVSPLFALAGGGATNTGRGLQVNPTGDIVAWNGATFIGPFRATNITGALTQCVAADQLGNLIGTGTPCGSGSGQGSSALSAITAATATHTINNSSYEQDWNWQLTGGTPQAGFGIMENLPSTNSGINSSLASIATRNGSTIWPLRVEAQWTGSPGSGTGGLGVLPNGDIQALGRSTFIGPFRATNIGPDQCIETDALGNLIGTGSTCGTGNGNGGSPQVIIGTGNNPLQILTPDLKTSLSVTMLNGANPTLTSSTGIVDMANLFVTDLAGTGVSCLQVDALGNVSRTNTACGTGTGNGAIVSPFIIQSPAALQNLTITVPDSGNPVFTTTTGVISMGSIFAQNLVGTGVNCLQVDPSGTITRSGLPCGGLKAYTDATQAGVKADAREVWCNITGGSSTIGCFGPPGINFVPTDVGKTFICYGCGATDTNLVSPPAYVSGGTAPAGFPLGSFNQRVDFLDGGPNPGESCATPPAGFIVVNNGVPQNPIYLLWGGDGCARVPTTMQIAGFNGTSTVSGGSLGHAVQMLTITGVTNASTITVSPSPISSAGQYFVYGTDDTNSWQSLINSLSNGSGAGRISFAGASIISKTLAFYNFSGEFTGNGAMGLGGFSSSGGATPIGSALVWAGTTPGIPMIDNQGGSNMSYHGFTLMGNASAPPIGISMSGYVNGSQLGAQNLVDDVVFGVYGSLDPNTTNGVGGGAGAWAFNTGIMANTVPGNADFMRLCVGVGCTFYGVKYPADGNNDQAVDWQWGTLRTFSAWDAFCSVGAPHVEVLESAFTGDSVLYQGSCQFFSGTNAYSSSASFDNVSSDGDSRIYDGHTGFGVTVVKGGGFGISWLHNDGNIVLATNPGGNVRLDLAAGIGASAAFGYSGFPPIGIVAPTANSAYPQRFNMMSPGWLDPTAKAAFNTVPAAYRWIDGGATYFSFDQGYFGYTGQTLIRKFNKGIGEGFSHHQEWETPGITETTGIAKSWMLRSPDYAGPSQVVGAATGTTLYSYAAQCVIDGKRASITFDAPNAGAGGGGRCSGTQTLNNSLCAPTPVTTTNAIGFGWAATLGCESYIVYRNTGSGWQCLAKNGACVEVPWYAGNGSNNGGGIIDDGSYQLGPVLTDNVNQTGILAAQGGIYVGGNSHRLGVSDLANNVNIWPPTAGIPTASGKPGVDFAPHTMTSNDMTVAQGHGATIPGYTNVLSSYIATSSTNYASAGWGNFAFEAFDGRNGFEHTWIGTGGGHDWLQIDIGPGNSEVLSSYAVQVTDFTMTGAQNGWALPPNTAPAAPQSWQLQGSNDGTTFTTLDTQTGQTYWQLGEMRTFRLTSTPAAYRYFRLNITANNGDPTFTDVGELYLYRQGWVGVYNASNPIPPAFLGTAPPGSGSNCLNDVGAWVPCSSGTGGGMVYPGVGIANVVTAGQWAPSYNTTTNKIPGTYIGSPLTSSTSGNAATATALATLPQICPAGQFPQGILASGNATGCASPSTTSCTVVPITSSAAYNITAAQFSPCTQFTVTGSLSPAMALPSPAPPAGQYIYVTSWSTTTFQVAPTGGLLINGISQGNYLPASAAQYAYTMKIISDGTNWIVQKAPSGFSQLTAGTVTGTNFIMGNSANLSFSGTGTVNANQLLGSAVPALPAAPGAYLQYNGSAFAWTTPAASGPGTGACTVNQYVNTLTAGNPPTCSQVTYAQLGGTVPTWNQSTTGTAATATALATAPTTCATGSAPTGIDVNGNALSCTSITAGGMVWPTNPGTSGTVPNYNGANGWGTSYGAANQFPSTFIPTLNQNTTGSAAKLAGGNIGYIPYQTGANSTGFLIANTAATDQVVVSHGTGAVGAAPTLSNAPALSAANMTSFPTLNQSTTGTASNITATSNNTLVTLSALALPYSQLTGTLTANTTGTAAGISPNGTSGQVWTMTSGTAQGWQTPAAASSIPFSNITTGTSTSQSLTVGAGALITPGVSAGNIVANNLGNWQSSTGGSNTSYAMPSTFANGYLQFNGSALVWSTPASGGLGDPGANGIIKRTALNTTAIAVAADYPTLNQSTTGNAATSTNMATNGTANQVWTMLTGTTQGWQTPAGSSTATNLAGGVVGSVPYQSAPSTTLFVAGNTANTDAVLTSHGTGSASNAPAFNNAPALQAQNMTNFPSTVCTTTTCNVTNSGTAGSAAKITASGTANQVWTMTSGTVQGWATPTVGAGTGACAANQYVNTINTTAPTCSQVTYSQLGGTLTANTTGTAAGITGNGTANQVWGMNSGGTAQGWQTSSGGSPLWSSLQNPTAPLNLNLGNFPTTFNYLPTGLATAAGIAMNDVNATGTGAYYLFSLSSTRTYGAPMYVHTFNSGGFTVDNNGNFLLSTNSNLQLGAIKSAPGLGTDTNGNVIAETSFAGNATTATNLSTSGTASQIWGMNSGGTAQGWQAPPNSGAPIYTASHTNVVTSTTAGLLPITGGTTGGTVTGGTCTTTQCTMIASVPADGTYQFNAEVVVTTVGAACTAGAVAVQITYTDPDSGYFYNPLTAVPVRPVNGISYAGAMTIYNQSLGPTSTYNTGPQFIRVKNGTALTYGLNESTAMSAACTTLPIVTMRAALYGPLGY